MDRNVLIVSLVCAGMLLTVFAYGFLKKGASSLPAMPLSALSQTENEGLSISPESSTYRIRDGNVYYADSLTPIEGADVGTFHYVGQSNQAYGPSEVAVDRNHVYRGIDVLVGLKPESLQILPNYLKDDASVYLSYPYTRVEDADAKTFTYGEIPNVASDKNYVYEYVERAMRREVGRTYLGNFYSKSSTTVFYKDKPIAHALLGTFEVLGGGYVAGVDVPKHGGYAKDSRAVYFAGREIPDADAGSFVFTPRIGYAKDKNNQYAFGVKIKDDFVTCGVDLSTLPEGGTFWVSKIQALDDGNVSSPNSFTEFCLLKDGSKLIGFVPNTFQASDQFNGTTGSAIKYYYLFGPKNEQINSEPSILDCKQAPNGGLTLPRSLDVLDGINAKLQCQWDGGCAGREIYILNLDAMRGSGQPIIHTNEYYDCGYRG